MHQVSGRWQLGLALSLTTALLWGVLPIALKALLEQMDAVTISWYRLGSAAVFVFFLLLKRKKLPDLKKQSKTIYLLLAIAMLGLTGNYVFYMFSIEIISASSAQVMIQIAPMLMLLGGVFFFKESFSRNQFLGFLVFIAGLILFFNTRFEDIFSNKEDYGVGISWMMISAVVWAGYALAQKQLLNNYSSNQIMLCIYAFAIPILLPISDVFSAFELTGVGWLLLAFCCINTIIAYGAFAEALAHWEASRVSAVLALTPLITIFSMMLLESIWPKYFKAESLNSLSFIGAGLVVLGSATTALAGRKKPQKN